MAFQSMLDIQISSVYRLTLSSAEICIIPNLGNTEDSMEFQKKILPLYPDEIRYWYFVHLFFTQGIIFIAFLSNFSFGISTIRTIVVQLKQMN